MHRLAMGTVMGVFAALIAAPALAGGWAVTTLDALPESMQAGETYSIGYTIRQHGERPFPGASPTIRVMRGDQMLVYKGMPDGEPGHYVSKVQFPGDGEWTWVVDQTPFATQELGGITIAAAPVAPELATVVQPALTSAASEHGWLGIGATAMLAGVVAVLLSNWRPFRAAAVR